MLSTLQFEFITDPPAYNFRMRTSKIILDPLIYRKAKQFAVNYTQIREGKPRDVYTLHLKDWWKVDPYFIKADATLNQKKWDTFSRYFLEQGLFLDRNDKVVKIKQKQKQYRLWEKFDHVILEGSTACKQN